MPAPEPKSPWYQFSLRSLLLFTLFVAVLCSIGACTHWLFSACPAVAALTGGVSGKIVAGTRLGFVQGAVFGIQFFFFTGCGFLSLAGWGLSLIAAPVGGVLGGIVGGLSVRTIKGNAADATDAKEHERRLSS